MSYCELYAVFFPTRGELYEANLMSYGNMGDMSSG